MHFYTENMKYCAGGGNDVSTQAKSRAIFKAEQNGQLSWAQSLLGDPRLLPLEHTTQFGRKVAMALNVPKELSNILSKVLTTVQPQKHNSTRSMTIDLPVFP